MISTTQKEMVIRAREDLSRLDKTMRDCAREGLFVREDVPAILRTLHVVWLEMYEALDAFDRMSLVGQHDVIHRYLQICQLDDVLEDIEHGNWS